MGGVFYLEDSTIFLSNCLFLQNYAINGGVIYLQGSEIIADNVIFQGNLLCEGKFRRF
jgi:predicted outer membrane repeat protein